MKKVGFLLLVLPLMVALVAVVVTADSGGNLVAGQNDLIGFVGVTQDNGNLVVTYNVSNHECWCINETHLHVGGELADIPQTKKGNPIPGQFDYAGYHDCEQIVTYDIPMNPDWGAEIIIAAHAVVWNGCECREETAWAGCNEFPGRNWATYIIEP